MQEEENLKYRIFQVAKWEIIRKRQKDMLARLNDLRDKRDRSLTFNAHVLLYCCLERVFTKFRTVRDKRKHEMKVLMGSLLMQIMMKFALKKRGHDTRTRISRKVKHCLTF